jgi:uncharacterized protein YbjT (DUF2867 family)
MRLIITGATGMVGEGVLLECLRDPEVTEVLSVSRRSAGISDPKLREYIIPDFLALKEGDKNLQGFDACFFCAGISSLGMKEPEYTRVTYDTTLTFARALDPKQQMTFIYVSGAGTDSSEKGRLMWARVKGRTENDLMKLPFRQVFAFRPAVMKITPGQKKITRTNNILARFYPVFNLLFPGITSTLSQVGKAMIAVSNPNNSPPMVATKEM